MRRLCLPLLLVLLSAPVLPGCGDDFEGGNRLTIQAVTDLEGRSVVIANALEKTDDSGRDGDPTVDDADGSQGDGFPDFGETVLVPLGDDRGVVTVFNEARLGVDPGVDLVVFRVDLTYFDGNGATRTFAPARQYTVTQEVPLDASAELTLVLVPVEMKGNGLRAIFLTGDPADIDAVRQWTVVVDVYARDVLNNDVIHAQGSTTVRFINPMVEEVAAE